MYSLAAFPEILFSEGEPYDRSGLALNSNGDPVSVWSAIQSMDDEDYAMMVEDVFGVSDITYEAVLEQIQETDTVDSLLCPIRVYIDDHWRITVYKDS